MISDYMNSATEVDIYLKSIMPPIRLETSRSALDRLLDPKNTSITLKTLDHAAKAIGKKIHIELVAA